MTIVVDVRPLLKSTCRKKEEGDKERKKERSPNETVKVQKKKEDAKDALSISHTVIRTQRLVKEKKEEAQRKANEERASHIGTHSLSAIVDR